MQTVIISKPSKHYVSIQQIVESSIVDIFVPNCTLSFYHFPKERVDEKESSNFLFLLDGGALSAAVSVVGPFSTAISAGF